MSLSSKEFFFYLFPLFFIVVNIPLVKALRVPLLSFSGYNILLFVVIYIIDHKTKRLLGLLKLALLFFTVMNVLFLIGWVNTIDVPHLHARDTCMQYVSDGTIYGDQPYCDQGVVTYYLTYFLTLLPFDRDSIMIFFYIISLTISFYFVYKIKERATADKSFLLIAVLFLLLTLKHPDMPTAVATIFLFSGFYALFYTRRKIIGSSLLTLALFSKATVMLIIGPIFLFYIVQVYLENRDVKKRERWKNILKAICTISMPSIIFLIFIQIVFPNYLNYYYFLHSLRPQQETYTYILTSLFSFKYAYIGLFLLFYAGWFMTLIRAFNKKFDIYSFISAISIPLLYIKFANAHNLFEAMTHFRYFIVFFPFYITLLYKLKEELPSFSRTWKFIFLLGILLLCIPLYQALGGITFEDIKDGTIFNDEAFIYKIQKEVAYPLLTINTNGNFLVSNDYPTIFGEENSFLYANKSQFIKKEEYVHSVLAHEPLDYTYADFTVKLGIVESLDPYQPNIIYNNSFIVDGLYNNKFDIIILWPYLDYTVHALKDHKEYLNKNYCLRFVPFLIGPHIPDKYSYVLVYIRDQRECQILTNIMIEYYQKQSSHFCHRSHVIEEKIREVLALNKIALIDNCNSITKTGVAIDRTQIQESYFTFLVLIFLLYIGIKSFIKQARTFDEMKK